MYYKHMPNSKLMLLLTLLTYDSQKRLSPPASRQPLLSQYLKSLPCIVSLDFCQVALDAILIKCFEKLVLQHNKDNIQASLGPHHYAFRTKRTTEDVITTALHSVFTHMENKISYIRIQFVDFSSVF